MPDDQDLPTETVDAVEAVSEGPAEHDADGRPAVEDAGRSPWETPPSLSYGLLFVVGLICAMFGVAIAPLRILVGGTAVPVGLLVVVAIPVIARAAAWITGTRLGAGCVALGWAIPTVAFAIFGPGGDILLPDVARTWVYLVGTALLLLLAVAVPMPRGARELAQARRTGRPDPSV